MSKRLGVALFGLGRIGFIHLKNIVVDSRLILYFVIDENVEAAKAKASSVGGVSDVEFVLADSAKTVFADERIDAVFICTPTSTHCQLVKTAIEHGKHIFCEKPISNNQNEIAELYELALKRNILLFCSFNRRFDPALTNMHESVQSKSIGRVLTVKTCSRDHPLPETCYLSTSNGIFHDCAVHDIDIVCWIYDQLPISVYVAASSSLEVIKNMGDVDSAIIVLKFPQNGLACIDISRISNYGYDQRVEVHGLEGMLVSENQYEHGMVRYGSHGIRNELLANSFNDRYRLSYINALDHFVSAVQDFPEVKKQLLVKGRDVLASCLIAEACKQSLSEGRPIALTWDNLKEF